MLYIEADFSVEVTLLQSASAAEIRSLIECDARLSFISPNSRRAISDASLTSRLIRSHSSSMTVRSSFRCSRSVSRSPSKEVTDNLIEVREVLKSRVIASRKTDFKRSLSCVDGILLVCICVFDPLLNNCGAGIKPAFLLCPIFTSTSFYIAKCLILRPIRVHPLLNKTRSTSNEELDYFDVDTCMGVP
jgi:hypothetical protein